MMRPTERPLELAPEAVNRIGMGFASDKFVSPVLDRPVRVAEGFKGVIAIALVSGNLRARCNGLLNKRHKRSSANLLNNVKFNSSLSFDGPKHGGFSSSPSPTLAGSNAADIGLVNLDMPTDSSDVFLHQKADLFGDPPCTFVGNSQLAFKFLRRHTVLGNTHQEDGMEPQSQRSRRLMEDCARRGRNLMSAPRARVATAFKDRVEAILVLATWTLNAVRVLFVEQERQTRCVIRELLSEIFDCVFHALTLPEGVPVVKV